MRQNRTVNAAMIGLLAVATRCSAGWADRGANDRPHAFVDTRPGAGELSPSFLCASTNDSFYYADRDRSYVRRLNSRGQILEFNGAHLNYDVTPLRPTADRDGAESERRQLMRREPVLFWLTNMRRYQNGVVLIHCFRRKLEYQRYVQVIDENLRVTRTWEDRRPSDWGVPSREPLAVMQNGSIVACGERGEILRYTPDGQVTNRYIIPGLFNQSRTISPAPIHEESRRLMRPNKLASLERDEVLEAKMKTALLLARDALLPVPIPISGSSLPSCPIDIDASSDADIAILDSAQSVFRLSATGAVTQVGLVGYVPREREQLQQLRMAGTNDLFLISSFRLFHATLGPISHVRHCASLPDNLINQINPVWDVLSLEPPTVVLANPHEGTVTNIVLPECP
ncbi:MAG: hypothetical protein WCP86_07250 [bacterium]